MRTRCSRPNWRPRKNCWPIANEEADPLGATRERLLADFKRAAVAAAQLATRLEEASHELATAQSALSAGREKRAAVDSGLPS